MKSSFLNISKEERRKEINQSNTFNQLIEFLQSSPNNLDVNFRRSSIHELISDLNANLSNETDWSTETTLKALTCLKLLGRSPIATEELESQLPLLIKYANLLLSSSVQFNEQSDSNLQSTLSNPSIIQESLRIIANVLFLHPLSRSSIDLIPAFDNLVQLAVSLPKESSPQASNLIIQTNENIQTYSFLASRIIFLITAVSSNLVIELIDKTHLVKHFIKAFKLQLEKKLNPQAHSFQLISHDILAEYLKIIFNLMVHFPQSLSQFERAPLETLSPTPISIGSPAASNTECGSPHGSPSAAVTSPASPKRLSSLKQRFNNQINFKKFRFRNQSEISDTPDHHQDSIHETALDNNNNELGFWNSHSKRAFFTSWNSSHSKVCSLSSSPVDEPQEPLNPVTSRENSVFSGLLPYLVQLFLLEPIPDPPNLKPPFNSYMQTFLNFLPSAHCFFDNYPQLPITTFSHWNQRIPPLINKLIMIIDRVTEYYCPNDPDDRSVKHKCQADGIELDVDLTQVFLLTANLISVHSPSNPSSPPPVGLSKDSREALIEMIIPSNIDRTIGLHKQSHLIGRILRLMNCVGFETLKRTCGGFLEALYAHNTDHLASQVGYGPLAGYFLSIGKPVLNPEGNQYSSSSDINPITGTYWATPDEPATPFNKSSSLSDEEKEAEAERLCGLFDRMNRNGVISVEDPRKLAVQSGRFHEIEKTVEADLDNQDRADEQEALNDLKKYKERKSKMAQDGSNS